MHGGVGGHGGLAVGGGDVLGPGLRTLERTLFEGKGLDYLVPAFVRLGAFEIIFKQEVLFLPDWFGRNAGGAGFGKKGQGNET